MIYSSLRRMLFTLPPELAHDLSLALLAKASCHQNLCQLLGRFNRDKIANVPRKVMKITFPNPVGLAAGLDKQATAMNALHALGFGWLELGTVTPLPQFGNPKPRLFRLTAHRAMINRLGFNSVGLEQFLKNINHWQRAHARMPTIIGINIGKNHATAMRHALDDYRAGLQAVYAYADYVAINISSPNTHNLRALHHQPNLDRLLGGIHRTRTELSDHFGRRVPLVLKIAPDLDEKTLDDIAELSRQHQIDGVAATNTTLSRSGVESHALAGQAGGLSGAPLATLSTATIAHLYRNLQGEIPIIGCGGIDSAAHALEKFQAGAELIQLYTGFIYHGPTLIREIIGRVQHAMKNQSVHTMHSWLQQLRMLQPPR